MDLDLVARRGSGRVLWPIRCDEREPRVRDQTRARGCERVEARREMSRVSQRAGVRRDGLRLAVSHTTRYAVLALALRSGARQ